MPDVLQDTSPQPHSLISPDKFLEKLAVYRMLPQFYREVLIDRAIAPLSCSEEEQAAALAALWQAQHLSTETEQQTWLQQHGMTLNQLRQSLARHLRFEQFKVRTWGGQLEAYFLKVKPQLDRVVYSLLRVQDAHLAQELYFRIQEGEQAFADLAQTYSQGTEAQTGGLVGPVPLSQPHPRLAQLLSHAKPGHLCAPQRIGDWWLVVRLERLIPAQLDEVTRRLLLDRLSEEWLQPQLQQLLQNQPCSLEDLASFL